MDIRTAFIAYVEDLAKRHVDIAHNPTAPASRRFFQELNYNSLMGPNEKPNNTGWNLVLMGFETALQDNRHGRNVERVAFVFDILKHVGRSMTETDLNELFAQAREIGEELLIRFEEHTKNPCNAAVSAGITVPYSLVLGSKKCIEVGPRYDAFYGYRFSTDVLLDTYVKKASDPAKWIAPA